MSDIISAYKVEGNVNLIGHTQRRSLKISLEGNTFYLRLIETMADRVAIVKREDCQTRRNMLKLR